MPLPAKLLSVRRVRHPQLRRLARSELGFQAPVALPARRTLWLRSASRMNLERRVLIASLLSAGLFLLYSPVLSRQTTQRQAVRPMPQAEPMAEAPAGPQAILPESIASEDVIVMESSLLKLEVGKQSAALRSVTLKGFQDLAAKSDLRFGTRHPVALLKISDDDPGWILASSATTEANWTAVGKEGPLALRMELDPKQAAVTIRLSSSGQNSSVPVQVVLTWNRSDPAAGQYNALEAVLLTKKSGPWQREYLRYREGARQPLIVPRGTFLVTLSERYFCQSLKPQEGGPVTATLLPTERGLISVSVESTMSQGAYKAQLYVGPRDFFHLRDEGFERAFPVGFFARIGLVLLVFLNGLAGVVGNYGVAVILLAGVVTAALSPFTVMGLRSMKKMQELQPRMEQLKKKHASDPSRLNQETFALFREHRVSPLGGCLPMLLQLPVFFALWSAISQTTGLRGERFLWIDDLSLPDRLARIGGFDLNILPILMAAAMYVQTKLSQARATTPQTAMLSGPLMSVMFGVMFYQVPAGLVLYWLTNSLVSIAWYRLAKL